MPRMSKAALANVQSVIAEKLDQMPAEYLDCRDPGLKHKWDRETGFHVIPVTQVGRKIANLQRIEACERCGVRKIERFIVNRDDLIEKIGQHYDYSNAPGYLMEGVGAPRGLKRSNIVWTAQYKRDMAKVAAQASEGKVTPIKREPTKAKTSKRKTG